MKLTGIIIKKIRDEGPVSFRDFMQLALYHPKHGYYTSPGVKTGLAGDYYTSPETTTLFGEMIGKQIEEMWQILGKNPFTIVEYGAGNGKLCYDLLQYLKKNNALYQNLRYCIIEISPWMVRMEKKLLHEKVTWLNNIDESEKIAGCIISNEVVDNFPVHQVVMEKELKEVYVDYDDGFLEVFKPALPILKNYLEELKVTLPYKFRTEINLQALTWLKEISKKLKRGFILTIDYGYRSEALYSDERSQGTLVCYSKHDVHDDPYVAIGKQDITSHVNFSALMYFGLRHGIQLCGYSNQAHFLQALGMVGYIRKLENNNTIKQRTGKNLNAILTLLADMGQQLKVLIQSKGIRGRARLRGMQFSLEKV